MYTVIIPTKKWHNTFCLSRNYINFYYFYKLFDTRIRIFVSVDIAGCQTRKQASISPPKKIAKVASGVCVENLHVEEDVKEKLVEELSKIRMGEPQEVTESTSECGKADRNHPIHVSEKPFGLQGCQMRGFCSFSNYLRTVNGNINCINYKANKVICQQFLRTLHASILEGLSLMHSLSLKSYATDLVHYELDLSPLSIKLLLYFIL